MRQESSVDPLRSEGAVPPAAPSAAASSSGEEVAALIRRVEAGDAGAEEELVRRFRRGLGLMLRRLTPDPALAEDVAQETFQLVIQKARAGEIRQPERFAGFLRSTARNVLIADRRKEKRYAALADVGAGAVGPSGDGLAAEEAADRLREPEPAQQLAAMIRDEEARQVRTLLGELRFERDRELLLRFYLTDAGKEEICSDLGVEPERFRKVLHRARQRLRELWERAERERERSGLWTLGSGPGGTMGPGPALRGRGEADPPSPPAGGR